MKHVVGDVFQLKIPDGPPDIRISPYKYMIVQVNLNKSYLLRNIVTQEVFLESEDILDQTYIFLRKEQHP